MTEGEVTPEVEIDQNEAHIKRLVEEATAEFAKTLVGAGQAEPPVHRSRWEERDARRKENARIAREAAQRRVERRQGVGLVQRVEAAQKKLNGTNVAGAIQLIQQASPAEYDLLIIGERYGQNRRGVLKQFGAPRKSVETAYLSEAGLASPEDALVGEE